MKIVTSSEVYAKIKPKKIHDLHEAINSGNKYSPYDFRSSVSRVAMVYDLDFKETVKYSAHMLNFTNLEVFTLLDKAIKIVEDTPEYAEYLLNDTFGEPKFTINPPGTLRFYSQDLICFYTGKNWRKIERPNIHI
jgi:hypothetical protein